MNILLLADLHSERAWYRWVLAESPRFDLVCIAGDLVDMFQPFDSQIDFLREEWLPAFIRCGKPLAICSGNHDHAIVPWLSMISHGNIIGDGQNQLLTMPAGEKLVITTCPYFWSFNDSHPDILSFWRTGARLREQQNAQWLVLNHEPPEQFSPERVINKLGLWIERFAPDYVSSGHFHESPAVLGRFCKRVGATWCFNSGCVGGTLIPNYIILNTTEGTAEWKAQTSTETEQTNVAHLR